MAALTIQTVSLDGVTPTYASAGASGDTFINDGRTFIVVKNANVSTARTVTINSLINCSQGSDHDIAVSVSASSEEWIGPFPPDRFNSSGGAVSMTYSLSTDLTVAAIKLIL